MGFKTFSASLIVLGLFALPALAEGEVESQQDLVQQDLEVNEGGPAIDVAAPAVPGPILKFLKDDRDISGLSEEDLRNRYRAARDFSDAPGLTQDVRDQLAGIARATAKELNARDEAGELEGSNPAKNAAKSTKQTDELRQTQKRKAVPDQLSRADVAARKLLSDRRDRNDIKTDELKARFDEARGLLQTNELSGRVERALQQFAEDDANALRSRGAGNAQALKPPKKVDQQGGDEDGGSQAGTRSERDARRFLSDSRPAEKLSDRELRQRLTIGRNLLGESGITDSTENRLRKMVKLDRDMVRARQAQAQAASVDRQQEAAAKAKGQKPRKDVSIRIDLQPVPVVLRDRRRSEELDDEELRGRIKVYRDIENSGDYSRYRADERAYWRRQMAEDRDYLRRKLIRDRQQRETELSLNANRGKFSIDLGITVPGPRDDIFVAEADDREIEEILVAPPREKVVRRFSVEEVAERPELRRAVSRIEVDTIRFGFNEAIVREEEVRSLDRIGDVIERILKRYPREVFLIEGHTDAVGSDLYNVGLSRARAEAVKAALSTYYNIPARNLRTVGLGERFLKIPTAEAEAENRRVSIGRITAFVGETG